LEELYDWMIIITVTAKQNINNKSLVEALHQTGY